MDPCPYRKKGRHDISVVLPEDADHDMTLFCDACGAVRRMPVNGSPLASRLDDLTTEQIAEATRHHD